MCLHRSGLSSWISSTIGAQSSESVMAIAFGDIDCCHSRAGRFGTGEQSDRGFESPHVHSVIWVREVCHTSDHNRFLAPLTLRSIGQCSCSFRVLWFTILMRIVLSKISATVGYRYSRLVGFGESGFIGQTWHWSSNDSAVGSWKCRCAVESG